jgi:hypothetical protein
MPLTTNGNKFYFDIRYSLFGILSLYSLLYHFIDHHRQCFIPQLDLTNPVALE